jgi:hypothetical protein
MISVWYGLVAAAGSVDVSGLVTITIVMRGALGRIGLIDFKLVLIHAVSVGVMETSVVQIVDVTVVLNGGVTAVGSVLVVVIMVDMVAHKFLCPFIVTLVHLCKCSWDSTVYLFLNLIN